MSQIKTTITDCLQHLNREIKHRQYGESICLLALPKHLHCHVKLTSFSDHTAIMSTTDACWLHQLRAYEPVLVAALTKAGYGHIQSIDWRINPRLTAVRVPPPQRKKTIRHVRPQTADIIAQSAQSCAGKQTQKQLLKLSETLRKKAQKA